jgi:hypothetical protein
LRIGDHGGDLGALGHVGARIERLDPEFGLDAGALLLDRRGLAKAVDDDVGALLGEGPGDGQADAARRAGDQRDLTFQHRSPPDGQRFLNCAVQYGGDVRRSREVLMTSWALPAHLTKVAQRDSLQ